MVIGVGNTDRGDDGAGPAVAHRVMAACLAGVRVVTGDDPVALLDASTGARELHIVDACRSGAEPGTVRHLDVAARPVPTAAALRSSHGLGVAEAIELARSLGRLPPTVRLHAVEAERCELGAGLSPSVVAAVDRLADQLILVLGAETDGLARVASTPPLHPR